MSVVALEERLSFETLLADLSSSFINVSPDELDAEIDDVLCRFCEHLGLDIGVLWQWCDSNPNVLVLTHLYRRVEGPPVPVDIDARQSFPWTLDEILACRTVRLARLGDAPPEARIDVETWQHFEITSVLVLPLVAGGHPIAGVLSFHTVGGERDWPDAILQRLQLVAEVFANALERKRADEELRSSYAEVDRLRRQLEQENLYLKQEYRLRHGSGRVVGESPAILQVLELVEQVAPTTSTVLIEGETGTGKELIAQRIHELSPRNERPMVTVNCAALPSTLVESELFGREKGAYTGAVSREAGRFEVANGSTLFLDEIAELSVELQSKLLRVLEEGQFERVGSSRTLHTDVRVIAATNRDLQAEVEAGRFRRDLFFRLAVFPIRVPPLRQRRQDIPLLVWSFVQELGNVMNRSVETISRDHIERLQGYHWPGNVRELRNVIERAMILSTGSALRVELPSGPPVDSDAVLPMDEAQRRHILKALERTDGRIQGAGGAAELLGLKPTTLRSKMQRLGIDPKGLRHD